LVVSRQQKAEADVTSLIKMSKNFLMTIK